jgi:hypothetical protein
MRHEGIARSAAVARRFVLALVSANRHAAGRYQGGERRGFRASLIGAGEPLDGLAAAAKIATLQLLTHGSAH